MSVVSSNLQDLLFKIIALHSRVIKLGTEVTLLWVPAHIGNLGNERVDKLAKQAVRKSKDRHPY